MTPSPFVVQWAPWVAANLPASRRALDVAMGRGRHVEMLGRAGFDVYGVIAIWPPCETPSHWARRQA